MKRLLPCLTKPFHHLSKPFPTNFPHFSKLYSTSSYSSLSSNFNEENPREALCLFMRKPNAFDATFLLYRKVYSLEEHLEIFEAVPTHCRNNNMLIPMILSLKRNGKESKEMMNQLIGNIKRALISEESIRGMKLSETTWDIVISLIISHDLNVALEIYEKTKTFVKYNDVTMKRIRKYMERDQDSIIQLTSSVKQLLDKNRLQKAIDLVEKTKVKLDSIIFIVLITYCTERKLLNEGVQIHKLINQLNISISIELSNSLMNFYTKCNHPHKAIEIFKEIKSDNKLIDVVTWNCAIQAFCSQHQIEKALEIFEEMKKFGQFNEATFVILFTKSAENKWLKEGQQLHLFLQEIQFGTTKINNAIMNFYTKCGHPEMSMEIFNNIRENKKNMNIVTWTCAIQALCAMKQVDQATKLILEMNENGFEPNHITYSSLITSCAENKCIEAGIQIHKLIEERNVSNAELTNVLMNFYTKGNQPQKALQIFDESRVNHKPIDVISWTCAIQALCSQNQIKKAMKLLEEMKEKGYEPNFITYTTLISSCTENKWLKEGEQIYSMINESERFNTQLINTLMNFYTKCDQPETALQIFNSHRSNNTPIDVITWNCAIQALCSQSKVEKALELIREMQTKGNQLDPYSIVVLLSALAEKGMYKEGLSLHNIANQSNITSLELDCALMNFYTKCNHPLKAFDIFNNIRENKKPVNVVTWTCAIQALCVLREIKKVMNLILEMKENGFEPNHITYSSIITSCAENKWIEEGIQIHKLVEEEQISSLELDCAVMNFYTKCENPQKAIEIFDEIRSNNKPMNVITWTCAIQALCAMKQIEQAIELITEMKVNGVEPNDFTFTCLLTCCADNVSIKMGEMLLSHFNLENLANVTCGSIINFYAKIGKIAKAEEIFVNFLKVNKEITVDLYNVMIDGYAKHGIFDKALKVFSQVLQKGLKPTIHTIMSVMKACSHAGRVNEALEIYKSTEMTQEVRTCLIDVLARKGLLTEALEYIGDSRIVIDWSTILGACRTYGNVQVAERAFSILIEIDKEQGSHYVQMSHIYKQNGQLEKSNETLKLMKENGAKRIPGITTVEINGETTDFVSNHIKHPKMKEINEELDHLNIELLEAGYVPDIRWVTGVYDAETKKKSLGRHSERIALAYAFISLKDNSPIILRNNLRVCGDCHSVIKLVSKIRNREILVRDAHRFHHFKDGKCSCNDFF